MKQYIKSQTDIDLHIRASLLNIRDQIDNLINIHGLDARLNSHCLCLHDHYIEITRLETDEEYSKRLADDKTHENRIRKNEELQYERLKDKLGK